MRALLENESSSVTIEKVRTDLKIPSMYHNSQRQTIESISEREIKEAVEVLYPILNYRVHCEEIKLKQV